MRPLIKIFFLKIKNYIFNLKGSELLRVIIFCVLLIGFFISAHYLFARIFKYLNSVEIVGVMLSKKVVEMALLSFTVMILFSNAVTALACMYMAKDAEYLLTLPIARSKIFTFKFLESTVHSTWMVILFSVPVLFSFGRIFNLHPLYYVFIPAALVPFSFLSGMPGAFAVNVIMYFFPPHKAKYMLVVIGVLFALALGYLFKLLNLKYLMSPEMFTNALSYLEQFEVQKIPFLPHNYIVETIENIMRGAYLKAFYGIVFLYSAFLALFAFFIAAGSKIYFKGLTHIKDTLQKDIRPKIKAASLKSSYIMKEFLIFLREPTQWSQLIILTALFLIHYFNLKSVTFDNYYVYNLISFLNIGIIGFFLAAVCVRFVFPLISVESYSLYFLRSSPLNLKKIFYIKFKIYFVFLFVLTQTIAFLMNRSLNADPFFYVLTFFIMLLMTLALTSFSLFMGAYFPKFNYNHISDISTSSGGILLMIGSLVYAAVTVSLLVTPVYIHFFERLNWKLHISHIIKVYGLIVFYNIVITVLSLKLGADKFEKTEI